MISARAKIVVDKTKKYIVQMGGDTTQYADFNEKDMKMIAMGPRSYDIDAIFKDSNKDIICTVSFSDTLEVSKNLLDRQIFVDIDQSGDIQLTTSGIDKFCKLMKSQHGVDTERNWAQI